MTSFADLQEVEPRLADRVRAILTSATNAVIGTVKLDGTPRLSGADPHFFGSGLYLWSMPGARKGQDLRRDPRVAIHSIPWDSRKLREDATDVGLADAKVSGRAELIADEVEYASFREWLAAERGAEVPDDWDLFRVDIDALAVVYVDEGRLAIDRWSSTDGSEAFRRE